MHVGSARLLRACFEHGVQTKNVEDCSCSSFVEYHVTLSSEMDGFWNAAIISAANDELVGECKGYWRKLGVVELLLNQHRHTPRRREM